MVPSNYSDVWYMCLVCRRCFQDPHKLVNHKRNTSCGRRYPRDKQRHYEPLIQQEYNLKDSVAPAPLISPILLFQHGNHVENSAIIDNPSSGGGIQLDSHKPCEILMKFPKPLQNNEPSVGSLDDKAEERFKFQCKFCILRCESIGSLMQHYKQNHSEDMNLRCYFCPFTTRNSKNYDYHIRTHTLESPFICERCGLKFRGEHTLCRHACRSGTFGCSDCGKQFKKQDSLNKHMLASHTKDSFSCKLCDIGYLKEHQLKAHLQSKMHFTKQRRLNLFRSKFNTIGKILDSSNNGKRVSKNSYCRVCRRSFPTGIRYNIHINSKCHKLKLLNSKVHMTDSQMISSHSPQLSKSKILTNLKMKRRRGVKLKFTSKKGRARDIPVRCDICALTLSDKRNMRNHEASASHIRNLKQLELENGKVSPSIPDESQQECGNESSVSEAEAMSQSAKEISNGATPIKSQGKARFKWCNYCKKMYGPKFNMNRHNRTVHLRKKRLAAAARKRITELPEQVVTPSASTNECKNTQKCHICHKVFSKNFKMSRHMNLVHLKRFSCHICHKIFGGQYDLNLHLSRKKVHLRLNKKGISNKPKTTGISNKPRLPNPKTPRGTLFSTANIKKQRKCNPGRCEICCVNFTQKFTLNKHLRTRVHLEKLKSMKSSTESKQESQETSEGQGHKPFKCSYCSKSYQTQYSLKTHMNVHYKLYQCKICFKYFRDIHDLNQHLSSNAHNTTTTTSNKEIDANYTMETTTVETPVEVVTEIVPEIPSGEAQLEDKDKSSKTYYQCVHCVRKFRTASAFTRHKRAAHRNIKKAIKASKAKAKNKKTPARLLISKGARSFNYNSKNQVKCSICPRQFTNIFALNSHMKLHKHLKKPVKTATASSRTNIIENDQQSSSSVPLELSGSSNFQNEFQCKFCPRKFASIFSFNSHMEFHQKQNQEDPIKCLICNKDFSRPQAYREHLKSKGHRAMEAASASNDKGQFSLPKHASPENLVNDITSTSNPKTNSDLDTYCKICCRNFLSPVHLTQHILLSKAHQFKSSGESGLKNNRSPTKNTSPIKVPPSVRPPSVVYTSSPTKSIRSNVSSVSHNDYEFSQDMNICSICGDCKENSVELQNHILGHDPNVCEICLKGFLTSSCLSRHLKTKSHQKLLKEFVMNRDKNNSLNLI